MRDGEPNWKVWKHVVNRYREQDYGAKRKSRTNEVPALILLRTLMGGSEVVDRRTHACTPTTGTKGVDDETHGDFDYRGTPNARQAAGIACKPMSQKNEPVPNRSYRHIA